MKFIHFDQFGEDIYVREDLIYENRDENPNGSYCIPGRDELVTGVKCTVFTKDTTIYLSMTAKEVVEAPIPGKILRVHVTSGDAIKEGEVVCKIEAMKMENSILAPVSGTVSEVKVSPDQIVQVGETMAVIEY